MKTFPGSGITYVVFFDEFVFRGNFITWQQITGLDTMNNFLANLNIFWIHLFVFCHSLLKTSQSVSPDTSGQILWLFSSRKNIKNINQYLQINFS
jgi:hypothetical protein